MNSPCSVVRCSNARIPPELVLNVEVPLLHIAATLIWYPRLALLTIQDIQSLGTAPGRRQDSIRERVRCACEGSGEASRICRPRRHVCVGDTRSFRIDAIRVRTVLRKSRGKIRDAIPGPKYSVVGQAICKPSSRGEQQPMKLLLAPAGVLRAFHEC